MDFPRVGVPLNLILWITASVLIPIFWPLVAQAVRTGETLNSKSPERGCRPGAMIRITIACRDSRFAPVPRYWRIDIVGLDQPDAGRVADSAQDRGVEAGGQDLVEGRFVRVARREALSLIVCMLGLSIQLSLESNRSPSLLCNSRNGSASTSVTPKSAERRSDAAHDHLEKPPPPPPRMKPPIITFSPVSTKPRVLMLASFESVVPSFDIVGFDQADAGGVVRGRARLRCRRPGSSVMTMADFEVVRRRKVIVGQDHLIFGAVLHPVVVAGDDRAGRVVQLEGRVGQHASDSGDSEETARWRGGRPSWDRSQ